MKQAIAGIAPPELGEVDSMTVWPSIAAWPSGRLIGRLCAVDIGYGFFTLGKLLAVAAIPAAGVLFFCRLLPLVARRYTLTNRRIRVLEGLSGAGVKAIDLDGFDQIAVEVLPGQEFLRAGELVFRRQGEEVLRLSGVPQPEGFRQACLKARASLVAVREVLRQQSETARPTTANHSP